MARVTKDSYCIYSSKYHLDKITYGKAINIDCKGFGNIFYKYDKVYSHSKKINQVHWKELYEELYKCRGATASSTYRNKILMYKVQENLNKENRIVYEILYKWIQQGEVPVSAQRILDKIEREIWDD